MGKTIEERIDEINNYASISKLLKQADFNLSTDLDLESMGLKDVFISRKKSLLYIKIDDDGKLGRHDASTFQMTNEGSIDVFKLDNPNVPDTYILYRFQNKQIFEVVSKGCSLILEDEKLLCFGRKAIYQLLVHAQKD